MISEGEYYGMQSFDQAIMQLYKEGLVDFQDALAHATSPTDFKIKAQNLGLMSA